MMAMADTMLAPGVKDDSGTVFLQKALLVYELHAGGAATTPST